jgi:L-asparaginase
MKKILIIYTGGTIGMVHDPVTNSLRPFDFERINNQVPELSRFEYELKVHSFSPLIDSSNITPSI